MSSALLSIILFGEGFLTGITLAIMIGPVTLVILRYGMQVNKIAGVWAATGTWISDVFFIAATFWMTATLSALTAQRDVRMWIFIVGGLGLSTMGAILLRTRRENLYGNGKITTGSYTQAFASGFLVNSLSPFTLFFWIGIALILHMQPHNPIWYYAGLMLSLAIVDFVKAWMAPKITRWIQDKYVVWIQIAAGGVILMTGLYLIGRGVILKGA